MPDRPTGRKGNNMKTYQIQRLNSNDEVECTYFEKGLNRLDAYFRAEGYDEEQKETVKTRKDGRYLIVSDPVYTSATFRIIMA